MAHTEGGAVQRVATGLFRGLARLYIAIHRPRVVVVAGSVGKTSTKLMLAKFLATEKKVSYMDDSYNSGIGLYLSVFEQKVPNRTTPQAWLGVLLRVIGRLFRHYEILLLEYGIDRPGEMDELIAFAQPDNAILTAVTPEHMEFLQTIDIVGSEETKVLAACKDFGVVNSVDVNKKYLDDVNVSLYTYGTPKDDASYDVRSRSASGSNVTFTVDGRKYQPQTTIVIADALIRQISGALLMAQKLGVSSKSLEAAISTVEPAASRMRPLRGIHDSMLIDDTANFSPVAGVVALQTLKQVSATRRIAVLGNMHELGEYIKEGYKQVGDEFDGIDVIVLVGDLSIEHFGAAALANGFKLNKTLFYFDTSTQAGIYVRDKLVKKGDAILIKGPFGGYYLEEATKKLLADPADSKYLTRQSEFWQHKKRQLFGASLNA
jgi:UDP-N-acetylmuramoyl-tripeptide--D-alanyl-D-alanine ligase